MKRAIDKVNHLNNMVQELLDLSQLQSRQLKLKFTAISVKSLIETFSEKCSMDMMNCDVLFKVHYPTGWQDKFFKTTSLFLMINMEKLERVFTNLLNNAVKYTSKGGHIELNFSITADSKELFIEVSDTGIGIPQDDLPHIFERFYTVSKVRQTGTSSGLGLAIVKEIVEYHDGQIWVESEVGRGSHFFFKLPIYNKNAINPDSFPVKFKEV